MPFPHCFFPHNIYCDIVRITKKMSKRLHNVAFGLVSLIAILSLFKLLQFLLCKSHTILINTPDWELFVFTFYCCFFFTACIYDVRVVGVDAVDVIVVNVDFIVVFVVVYVLLLLLLLSPFFFLFFFCLSSLSSFYIFFSLSNKYLSG